MEKEYEVKIGANVKCKALEFSLPIKGTIKYVYNNTAVVFVEQVQAIDQIIAVDKNYMALALIKDIDAI